MFANTNDIHLHIHTRIPLHLHLHIHIHIHIRIYTTIIQTVNLNIYIYIYISFCMYVKREYIYLYKYHYKSLSMCKYQYKYIILVNQVASFPPDLPEHTPKKCAQPFFSRPLPPWSKWQLNWFAPPNEGSRGRTLPTLHILEDEIMWHKYKKGPPSLVIR